ncbi:MAG: hypothetical protein VX874_06315 [Pseudomonadota bacterium]|nr:hypothetical protein [Pseudomonadota bacterium]
MRWLIPSVFAAVALLPGAAQAQDWSGLVIGQSSPEAELSFADAYHASAALRAGQGGQVRMLRDAPAGSAQLALSEIAGDPRVVLYYSGPLTDEGTALALPGGAVSFDDVMTRFADAGTSDLALLIEDCTARAGAAQGIVAPTPPEGLAVTIHASAGPDGDCPAYGDRLTDRLSGAEQGEGQTLDAILAGLWTGVDEAAALTLFASVSPGVRSTSTTAARPVTVAPAQTTIITPVITAVEPTAAVARVTSGTTGRVQTGAAGQTTLLFDAPAQSQIAAIPVAAGLPEPSIIVGVIEGAEEASFDTAEDLGEVTSSEIAYDDLAARESLRESSPELFAELVAAGAFDPPANLMARAIQTELARMNCYNAGIDGVWGNGSRGAVDRYFAQREAGATTREAVAELFRAIILNDDVTCPAPVAAPAPVARNTNTAPATPRAAPAPTPAPAQTQSAPQISGNRLGGTFR